MKSGNDLLQNYKEILKRSIGNNDFFIVPLSFYL